MSTAATARPSRARHARALLHGWHLTGQQVTRAVVQWIVGSLVLGLTVVLLPGVTTDHWWLVPLAVIFVALVGAVLRPILTALALMLGWIGVLLLGLFSQALVLFVALEVMPGLDIHGFANAFIAAWVVAGVETLVGWLMLANQEDAFIASCMRHATRGDVDLVDPEQDGVVFMQMDGMPMPILRWGVSSGTLPTLARWMRQGTHRMQGWTVRVPSTTPVSQAGFLHGSNDNMPAFRWYERDSGRLIVANHPPDAALIESRLHDGHGLLADDGASIGNLFSGDAPTSLMTMSGMVDRKRGMGSSRSYAHFFADPYGFARILVLGISECIKEMYQARHQRLLGIEPRVHRGGSYILLRAATNVVMRDLQTALVVEQMMKGTKSIYVDFVDYDEIAHHAGPTRDESLRSLQGLDHVLGVLAGVADQAPRRYHFVVVSDHGQSQGDTFRQRFGTGLEDVVRSLMGGAPSVTAATGAVEDWGPVNTFLSQIGQQASAAGRLVRRLARRRTEDGAVSLGPRAAEQPTSGQQDLVVCGSGNLGVIWFAQHPQRLTYERIEELWPGMTASLATHPGISFVVVLSEESGAIAIGPRGMHYLDEGRIVGEDPLAPFGPQAAIDMQRCAHFDNAPDIYVNSLYNPETDEVAAFEELVGCHGGLGGWQTRASLVYPAGWDRDDESLVGADAVHRQFVRWLEQLGHRTRLDGANGAAAPSAEQVPQAVSPAPR